MIEFCILFNLLCCLFSTIVGVISLYNNRPKLVAWNFFLAGLNAACVVILVSRLIP